MAARTGANQVPIGHTIVDGRIVPSDWSAIVFGKVMMVHWPQHMLLDAALGVAVGGCADPNPGYLDITSPRTTKMRFYS
jgi:hypothetical protein